MAKHSIYINGILYENIGEIKDDIETEYYYNVVTLDGTSHSKIRWQKTHKTVTFFNLHKSSNNEYDILKAFIKANQNQPINCGFPNASGSYDYADYYLINNGDEINKGMLNGSYYKTGLNVYFQKVSADE